MAGELQGKQRTEDYAQHMNISLAGALAAASAFLLHLAFVPDSNDAWLLIAFVPWMLLLSDPSIKHPQILLGSVIMSGAYSALLFESIVSTHMLGTLLGTVLNIPQVLAPSLIFAHFNRRDRHVPAFIGMSLSWYSLTELRAHPSVSGVLALDTSIHFTFNADSIYQVQHVPGLIILLTVFLFAYLLAIYLRKRHLPALFASFLLLICVYITPELLSRQEPPQKMEGDVRLLQTAFTALEVSTSQLHSGYTNHIDYSLQSLLQYAGTAASLVIMPETSLRSTTSISRTKKFTREANLPPVITGAISRDPDSGIQHNSALLFDNLQSDELFRKWQLVPLYESSVFARGSHVATVAFNDDTVLGILICMDGVFDVLIAETISAGATHLLILNASDYGLGYRTPELQKKITATLSRKHGVPIMFVTTNGPTSVIDAHGIIQAETLEGSQTVLAANLPQHSLTGRTQYVHILEAFVSVAGIALMHRSLRLSQKR